MLLVSAALASTLFDAQSALAADHCNEAVTLFDRALYELPGDARAYAGLALCQARLEQGAAAMNTLEQAFKAGDSVIRADDKYNLGALTGEEESLAERQIGEALRLLVDDGYGRDIERALPAAERLAGPSGPRTAALAWIARKSGAMEEAWGVFSKAATVTPDDPLLAREAARFAFKEGRTLPTALDTWILAHADASGLYDLVAGSINAQQWTRCLSEVRAAGDRFPEGPAYGYRCALQAGDAAEIVTWRTVVRAKGQLAATDVVVDVNRLIRAGDLTTAESLLVETLPKGAADTAALAGARVALYSRQGRWEEAVTAAQTKGIDPRVMAGLATQLARMGRTDTARTLVQGVCDSLAEPQRTACFATAPGFGP